MTTNEPRVAFAFHVVEAMEAENQALRKAGDALAEYIASNATCVPLRDELLRYWRAAAGE